MLPDGKNATRKLKVSLVHKLIRAGYYWPTMQKDALMSKPVTSVRGLVTPSDNHPRNSPL